MLAQDPRLGVLDALTGEQFEQALVELFEALGYDEVERIGGFDKGADLILSLGADRIAVQASPFSSTTSAGRAPAR